MRMLLSLAQALAIILSLSGSARAEISPQARDRLFLMGNGAFGSASTGGFGLGAEFPVAHWSNDHISHYLSLGPLLGLNFGYGMIADFDVLFRAKFPVKFTDERFTVSLGVPLGFTLNGSNNSLGFGWNTGLKPTAEFFVTDHVGIFLEMGLVYHGFTRETAFVHLLQGQIGVGIAYAI